MQSSKYQKSLDYFQNLYLIAIADAHLAKAETSFLVKVAQQLGLGIRDTYDIMRRRNELELILPESEEAKQAQLEDIITMMMIDQKIHSREYQLCLSFAEKIGKNKQSLDLTILKLVKSA